MGWGHFTTTRVFDQGTKVSSETIFPSLTQLCLRKVKKVGFTGLRRQVPDQLLCRRDSKAS